MRLKKIGIITASLLFVISLYSGARANPGDLDPTFDADGKILTPIATHDYAQDVAIQPDGKIVVSGSSTDAGNDNNVSLARYNADGSLDTGFGTGGKVFTDLLNGNDPKDPSANSSHSN